MQFMHKASGTIVAVAALAAMMTGTANAVPCGAYSTHGGITVGATDLGLSSATCRNGATSNDSAGALNAGGGFFGIDTWTQLNKVPDSQPNASLWSFNPVINDGKTLSGTFTLAAGIWDLYSDLVVVLKDGGSTLNKDVKWSAYLLPESVLGTYNWSYDNRKAISHISLYGIVKTTVVSVPEPASLLMLGLGLAGGAIVLRRRKASRPA